MTPWPVTASKARDGAILGGVTHPDSPRVGLSEAAAMTKLSLSTLRRRRQELRAHGAIQKEDGSWSIPIHALVDLGMLDHVTVPQNEPTQSDPATDEVADLRVEVERERGLRFAAEREVQAIMAHLATAQNTIRMIEAAPPKVETRVERVEVPVEVEKRVEVPVPVTPRWVRPAIATATLLLLLLALLAGWTLIHDPDTPAPQETSSGQQSAPPTPLVWPDVPMSVSTRSGPGMTV